MVRWWGISTAIAVKCSRLQPTHRLVILHMTGQELNTFTLSPFIVNSFFQGSRPYRFGTARFRICAVVVMSKKMMTKKTVNSLNLYNPPCSWSIVHLLLFSASLLILDPPPAALSPDDRRDWVGASNLYPLCTNTTSLHHHHHSVPPLLCTTTTSLYRLHSGMPVVTPTCHCCRHEQLLYCTSDPFLFVTEILFSLYLCIIWLFGI